MKIDGRDDDANLAYLAGLGYTDTIKAEHVGPAGLDGFLEGAGTLAMQGAAKAGKAAAIVAITTNPITQLHTAVGDYDFRDEQLAAVMPTLDDAVNYWAPDPHRVGRGGQIVGGFLSMAPALAVAGGNPEFLALSEGVNTGADLTDQGVDTTHAVVGGLTTAVATEAGFRVPFLGKSLAGNMATGAAGMTAINAASAEIQKLNLEHAGRDDLAAGYDPLDPTARAVDVLGGLLGGFVHHAAGARAAAAANPEAVDAALTLRNAEHFTDTAHPGTPATPGASVAAQDALGEAIAAVLRGEPVHVADAIQPDMFVERPVTAPVLDARDVAATVPGTAEHGVMGAYPAFRRSLESKGQADDVKNPASGATGRDQFIGSTWNNLVSKYRPSWAEGLTPAQILDERKNPDHSAEMAEHLDHENAAALRHAGVPVDNYSLYAAHHFGADRAVAFAKAAGDTPMSEILAPEQLAANGYLAKLTKDGTIANWGRRAGTRADVVALIKPLGIETGIDPEARAWLASHGATVENEWSGTVDTMRIAEHYQQFADKPFFPDLVNYWTGRDATALHLSVPIERLDTMRAELGSAKPEPGSVRDRLLGSDRIAANLQLTHTLDNGIHLSDSADEGLREKQVWFGTPKLKTDRPETIAAHDYLWNSLKAVAPDAQFSGSLYSGLAIASKLDDLDYRILADDVDTVAAKIGKIPGLRMDREGIDEASGQRYVKFEFEWDGGKADIAVVPREAYRHKIAQSTMANFMPAPWIADIAKLKSEAYAGQKAAAEQHGKNSEPYRAAKAIYESVKDRAGDQVRRFFGLSKAGALTPAPGKPVVLGALHARDQRVAEALFIESQGQLTPAQMYAVAVENQTHLVSTLRDLGLDVQLSPEIETGTSIAGEKTRASFDEKTSRKGNHAKITDLTRATVIVDNPAEAQAAITSLGKAFPLLDDGQLVTSKLGYMDRKVKVKYADGTIGEVQFMPQAMHDAKELHGGHELYNALEKAPEGSEGQAGLAAESMALYAAAIKESGPQWASVYGAPLGTQYMDFRESIGSSAAASHNLTLDGHLTSTHSGARADAPASSRQTLPAASTAYNSSSNLNSEAPAAGQGSNVFGSTVVSPSGESSIPPANLGREAHAFTERGDKIPVRWAVVEAGDLVTSHDNALNVNPDFPAEIQPRDRTRAASEAQIAKMANGINPELLGESPKASDGAPIVGRDKVVESGNARTIALRRAYANGKADGYVAWLREHAEQFGLNREAIEGKPIDQDLLDETLAEHGEPIDTDTEAMARWSRGERVFAMHELTDEAAEVTSVAMLKSYTPDQLVSLKRSAADAAGLPEPGMREPMLVRVAIGEHDRAEFARQANESSVAKMSPSEQAASDAARMPDLGGLIPKEDGTIDARASSGFIGRFMKAIPPTEHGSMMDGDGKLSQEGQNRIRTAVFAKAYGAPELVAMLTESTDANVRTILTGMMKAAARVAKQREDIAAGTRHPVDFVPDLVRAVREFSALRSRRQSVRTHLEQSDIFSGKGNPTTNAWLIALDENSNAPRRMADLLTRQVDAVDQMGNPGQVDMLSGDVAPTTDKAGILQAAVDGIRRDYRMKPTGSLFGANGKPTAEAKAAGESPPPEPLPEAEPLEAAAAADPGGVILDGVDPDGNPRYRTAAEVLAEIQGERERATKAADAYQAAINCHIQHGAPPA